VLLSVGVGDSLLVDVVVWLGDDKLQPTLLDYFLLYNMLASVQRCTPVQFRQLQFN
jgi:hypothetical protein